MDCSTCAPIVDDDTLALAHALRSTLRELALANTLGVPLAGWRREAVDATLARFPLGARLVDGEPGLLPGDGAGPRASGRSSRSSSRPGTAATGRG